MLDSEMRKVEEGLIESEADVNRDGGSNGSGGGGGGGSTASRSVHKQPAVVSHVDWTMDLSGNHLRCIDRS